MVVCDVEGGDEVAAFPRRSRGGFILIPATQEAALWRWGCWFSGNGAHFYGLGAVGAVEDLEVDNLPDREKRDVANCDGAFVNEKLCIALVRANTAVALFGIKTTYGTTRHRVLSPYFLMVTRVLDREQ
jgi:hypothetical protein